MNTKTLLAAFATTLICAAAAHAQNYSQNYNSSYTGPNGRTVSYNQSYSQGAGGFFGTGCPNGVGWAIFAINAVRGSAAGQPIPTPTAMGAGQGGYGGGGGYYGGGGCYGAGMYGQAYSVPTYRAGYGVAPY